MDFSWFFYFFLDFFQSFGFMGGLPSSFFFLPFLLLLLLLLFFFYCRPSSSSSSSPSPSGACRHPTNSSSSSTVLSLIWGGSSANSTGYYGCSPSPAHHSPASPQVYYSCPWTCQGIFSFRVPGPAQGASRVVSGTHVVPDTSATTGGVPTLSTLDGVMALILMA